MSIKKVIENGYCVGCGACKLELQESVSINLCDNGFYQAKLKAGVDPSSIADKICPFSSSYLNETELGEKIYGDKQYEPKIGYYNQVYAGHVINHYNRNTSSSGGLTTWFAKKLLENKVVDGIVHVGQTKSMFGYIISYNIDELEDKKNKKSRYYPVSFSDLIAEINNNGKNYLFIGIPCFVKSIRLAQEQGFVKNITYVFSLLCGHMKSADFSKSLAWQLNVLPDDVRSVDFRVKVDGHKANDYFIEVENVSGIIAKGQSSSLFGTNWGLGFFKHKACDFCDDIAGELADMTFGDAWLPQFLNDSQGTNIVISRNDYLDTLLVQYSDEISIVSLKTEDFYNSQAGNYRHRREGLITRIDNERGWVPQKRVEFSTQNISNQRKKIYLQRSVLSRQSIRFFAISKKINSFQFFKFMMSFSIIKYEYFNSGIVGAIKEAIRLVTPKRMILLLKKIK